MLRAARERQGLHIAALAAAIKVTPRKLDALENDRWQELPDATFARALAQTVCRTLKIDARPVLALLPVAGTAGLDRGDAGLNQPFRPGGRDDASFAVAAIRPMVWAAAALMLAAVVLYLLPTGPWSDRQAAAPASAPAAAASAASAVAVAASAAEAPLFPPADAAASAAPASAATAVAPPVSTGTAVSTVAVPMVVATPMTAVAPPPAATASAAVVAPAAAAASAPGAGVAQLRGSQASWVQVRDARGQVLVSRTLLAGETLGIDGALPLRLTIGNAAGMQLVFRGRPVDLAPVTRDNVARVELQ